MVDGGVVNGGGSLVSPGGHAGDKIFDMMASTPRSAEYFNPEPDYSRAVKINRVGKFMFFSVVLIFNVIFWIVAMQEYNRPAEEYL